MATETTLQDLLEAATKGSPDVEGPVTEVTYDIALIGPDKAERAVVGTYGNESNGRLVADTYNKSLKDEGSYYAVRKVTTVTEVVYRTEPAKKRKGTSPVAKAALKRDAERKAARAEKAAKVKKAKAEPKTLKSEIGKGRKKS